MVLVAFLLRLALQDRAGSYGFILFMPAIMAASFIFDRGSGFLALVLSATLVALTVAWDRDVGFHIAALAIFAIVSAPLVLMAEALNAALKKAHDARQAQALLLEEMSHRVKNKFAMILSLIGLQARQANPETRQALEAIAQRVRAIASMHDHLQLASQDNLVDMSGYLGDLGRSLGDAVRELRPVTVSVAAEPLRLEPGSALSIGLIVNELVTNAFKYAFADDQIGHVAVRFELADGHVHLSVADDGIGCPEASEPGLGTRLVTLLVDQLGGSIKRENLAAGCRVSVTLPDLRPRSQAV